MFEDADGSADFVIKGEGAFVFEDLPGGDFGHDDAGDDGVVELVEDFLFGAAEGGLVGDLVEVADGFGAFAVETADGEVHVFGGAEYFFNVAGHFEGGEMEHDGDAEAGAEVGGAGGEETEAL